MRIPISIKILNDFELKDHEYLVDREYYDSVPGFNEYRLYSYLSTFFNNVTILDIGTLTGRSAIALSYNRSNKVISYDIVDNIRNRAHKIYTKENVTFNIKDVLDDLTEDFVKNVKIVMIDIDHYETIERKIIDKLKSLGFSGLIILDDTTKHPVPAINACMNRLWNSIEDTKYDFTPYGHITGTGIVVINDDITFDFS